MGRTQVFGGWGFDTIDLRASTYEDGGLNDGPVPNLINNGNGTYSVDNSTSPAYGTPEWEALAYGGAGEDIMFAGTGGDRLIDWVGNHNSYYVPFSQFGMPTVSRTLMPFLPEFLYALSKSDGADQTLGLRADAFCASSAGSTNSACSAYPKYSGTAARNGEPFGELGLVLQHDQAWHQESGPPFNEMPENLGGTGIDIRVGAAVLPIGSYGTCPTNYAGHSKLKSACTSTSSSSLVSLPSGIGTNLPSGTNATGASAMPFTLTGIPGASVTYTFTEGTNTVTGSGVIGSSGLLGGTVDLSGFPDGMITVTIVQTLNGVTTTITGTVGKNSVAPPAPTVSAPAYANIANQSTYNVTVTGQVGAIATVVISDGAAIANQSNGMDFVGSNGSVTIPIDVSGLNDGTITISVTLTNGSGNSYATTLTEYKDTVPPPLTVSLPPYVNNQNASSLPIYLTGEKLDPFTYSFTQGKTTVTGSSKITGDSTWTGSVSPSRFVAGLISYTFVETDEAGNTTTVTGTVLQAVATPATPTVTLSQASDSGSSSTDYITSVTSPTFNTTSAAATTVAVYVNGVLYTGQHLANGSYTVTAKATDQYGNLSAAGTAPKTLVINSTGATGSFTVSGAKSIGGQLSTASKTPSLALSLSSTGGIASIAVSTNGGVTFGAPQSYAATVPISLASGDGIYTIVVQVLDVAGNTTTFSLTVRLDTTGPTITASLPTPQQTIGYDGTANITPAISASDISTISSTTLKVDGTAISGSSLNIYTLAAGTHTLLVTSVDGLGNSATVTLSFAVHPSLTGVIDAVKYGLSIAAMSSTEETTLLGYLNNKTNTVKTDLTNFLNAVKSASGTRSLTAAEATLLTSWANDLYSRS
jgi:hypothetical protein